MIGYVIAFGIGALACGTDTGRRVVGKGLAVLAILTLLALAVLGAVTAYRQGFIF